jgi:hypothetical protein
MPKINPMNKPSAMIAMKILLIFLPRLPMERLLVLIAKDPGDAMHDRGLGYNDIESVFSMGR